MKNWNKNFYFVTGDFFEPQNAVAGFSLKQIIPREWDVTRKVVCALQIKVHTNGELLWPLYWTL